MRCERALEQATIRRYISIALLSRSVNAFVRPRTLSHTALSVSGIVRISARRATMAASWDASRERPLKAGTATGDVLYWMARDQRCADNWALLRAAALAKEHQGKARVVYALGAISTERRLDFQLKGLVETGRDLNAAGFGFDVLVLDDAPAGASVAAFAATHKVAHVVCDYSPLREAKAATKELVAALPAPIGASVVDAHNIVPVWEASPKQEVGARTLRKKITEQLPRYLKEIPQATQGAPVVSTVDWRPIIKQARQQTDRSVPPVDWLVPGAKASFATLETFIKDGRLKRFAKERNDPNVEAASHLSPYLNFGQHSAQRAALRVKAERSRYSESVASFLEESIIRRELSDNFCHYQPNYDSLEGAAAWARDSLELHATDKREHLYNREQLENAEAFEDVWNAAQRQLVRQGKMHGFMRMYWAKKVLEWSASPAEALATTLYLNDKYSLDGCDPNGFVGCAWSVMGTHDMGWKEREVFGKIRFMNYNGCKRKFDVQAFVAAWPKAARPAKRAKK